MEARLGYIMESGLVGLKAFLFGKPKVEALTPLPAAKIRTIEIVFNDHRKRKFDAYIKDTSLDDRCIYIRCIDGSTHLFPPNCWLEIKTYDKVDE